MNTTCTTLQVEIEVEACDKGGTFLGTIVLPGPKPINLGLTLARMGLAKTQQFFAADRCGRCCLLPTVLPAAVLSAVGQRARFWSCGFGQLLRQCNHCRRRGHGRRIVSLLAWGASGV